MEAAITLASARVGVNPNSRIIRVSEVSKDKKPLSKTADSAFLGAPPLARWRLAATPRPSRT
jgi:hypothetical protein